MTLARHTDYIREVQADQDRLLSAAQLRENDEDDDWETEIMTLVVTVADLEGLCSETVSPIHDYDTIVLQEWKRRLVAILSQFPNKLHDHGHAYLFVSRHALASTNYITLLKELVSIKRKIISFKVSLNLQINLTVICFTHKRLNRR